jgi:hypothetical protein
VTVSEGTEKLIERLVAEAAPVRRLRPPLVRAALWLLAVTALAAAAVLLFSDLDLFGRRVRDPKLALELVGTLATGLVAVIAAFYLSLPDRSRAWALAPLPFLVLWIASSGYSCYRHWLSFGPDGWVIGESAECFAFILAVSLPIGISLLLLLRRARPLTPVSVAAVGGLGAAGIAAFLLQFFHPFDVTFMDLAVHALAIAIVVMAASAIGRAPQPR